MIREVKITADLQQNQLQIKSSSLTGPNDYVLVYFYDEADNVAGCVTIWLGKVWLCYCQDDEPTNPIPADEALVWSFFKVGTTIQVECNGVLVLQHDISQCKNQFQLGFWQHETKMIKFDSMDTGAQEYRVIPQGIDKFEFKLSCYFLHSHCIPTVAIKPSILTSGY